MLLSVFRQIIVGYNRKLNFCSGPDPLKPDGRPESYHIAKRAIRADRAAGRSSALLLLVFMLAAAMIGMRLFPHHANPCGRRYAVRRQFHPFQE